MASMVAGGVFNAFAFAGAGYLFSKINKKDYAKEAERHNQATEKLQKAKEEFYEQQTKRQNKIRQLQNDIREAKYNMQDTSEAFNELRELKRIHQDELREPKLEDFYQPSDEMEKYKIIVMVLAGSGFGWLLFKFV